MSLFTSALRDAMERDAVTQSSLVTQTRLSQGTISAYMNDRRQPDLRSLVLLCAALPELLAWFATRVYAERTGEPEPAGEAA